MMSSAGRGHKFQGITARGKSRLHAGDVYNVAPAATHGAGGYFGSLPQDRKDQMMFRAAGEGQYRRLELLLKAGANVDFIADGVWDALSTAVCQGHIECSRLLIDYGADVNAKHNDSDVCPLELAIMNGHFKILSILLDHKSDPRNVNALLWNEGLTAAIMQNDSDAVKTIVPWIDHGAGVNATDDEGFYPLEIALRKGYFRIVDILMDHKANPSIVGLFAWERALIEAIRLSDLDKVKMVLPKINDFDFESYGERLLISAGKIGNPTIIKLLLEAGGDVSEVDSDGFQCIHHAAQNGHTEALAVIVEWISDVDVPVSPSAFWKSTNELERGETALSLAADNDHGDAVAVLLEGGAVATFEGLLGYGYTFMNNSRVISQLKKRGCDLVDIFQRDVG